MTAICAKSRGSRTKLASNVRFAALNRSARMIGVGRALTDQSGELAACLPSSQLLMPVC